MGILFFIYGIFIGSFLSLCAYRIPRGISIINEPSTCSNCGHRLNYIDMLPVANYIVNKGKCKYCNESYSIKYPVTELLNGLVYSIIGYYYGFGLLAVFYCITISILLTLSIIDLEYKIIPDRIILFYFMIVMIFNIAFKNEIKYSILGMTTGFVVFLLIAVLTNAMGGGDVKLMAVIGFMFGVKGVIFITLFSFIIGATVSIILLVFKIKDRKDEIAFGPFISVTVLMYILYGQQILLWYMRGFY